MFGSADAAGKNILMLANVRERCVRLLELPTFTERGVLPDVSECAAVSAEAMIILNCTAYLPFSLAVTSLSLDEGAGGYSMLSCSAYGRAFAAGSSVLHANRLESWLG